jgi:heterodisulfide reductase subunit A
VNVREQCSWAHTDDREGATDKAIRLVRAGIARTRLTASLEPTVVETQPRALVIGAGVTGLRSALGLADLGLGVFLVERAPEVGGWLAGFEELYPSGRRGRELVAELAREVRRRENITVFTHAEVVRKAGSFGNFQVDVRVRPPGQEESRITVNVGAILVATGFASYEPQVGEYGYGMEGVLTLPEFKQWIDHTEGPLNYRGHPVKTIAYIYCVGSRQPEGQGNAYCSRYCCSAAVHASLETLSRDRGVHQYHLYRDMRTYGRYELMYTRSREEGVIYLKFDEAEPPAVARGTDGRLAVTVKDALTDHREVTIPADLVVLVTGMVPRPNQELVSALKLPVGRDGFFNEIHPKLRPVETVVDGVSICGACQGPKNVAESVASGLAAVSQAASILKPGRAELDPQVAKVDPEACTGCGLCVEACPYEAIELGPASDGRPVASVNRAVCKGCGGCVPVCPEHALDLEGYTRDQLRAMIDGLIKETVSS